MMITPTGNHNRLIRFRPIIDDYIRSIRFTPILDDYSTGNHMKMHQV